MVLTLTNSSEPEPQGNVLAMGNNSISISTANGWGVKKEYTFTSAEGGDFVLSYDSTQYSYVLVIIGMRQVLGYDDGEEAYMTSYRFSLAAGGSITFKMNTSSETDYQYVLKLAYATAESLSLGDNRVSASWDGEAITFTSEEGGKFILSTLDRNAVIYLDINEEPICGLGANYSFTLEANGSITFYMCTQYPNPSVEGTQYIVNIAVDNSSSEGGSDDGGSGNALTTGENKITANWDGVFYTFTSESGGTFKVTSTDDNFMLYDTATETSYFADSDPQYSFTIAAGGSITLDFVSNSFTESIVTYTITIEAVVAE